MKNLGDSLSTTILKVFGGTLLVNYEIGNTVGL
jgi:hypothetical protein